MIVSLLIYYLSISTFHSIAVSVQPNSFTQPATGPSSVCKGSDVTLQCRIVFINDNDEANEQDSIWTRNGTRVVATTPNHRLMMNSTTGRITNLIITNVTLADDNSVYNCTDNGATIASFVVLNVTDPLNAQLNLTEDNCGVDSFDISWRLLTQLPCDDELSYNVSLSERTLTGNYSTIITTIIRDTSFSFTKLTSNTLYLVEVFLIHYDVGSNKSYAMNVSTKMEPSTNTTQNNDSASVTVAISSVETSATPTSSNTTKTNDGGDSNTTLVIIIVVVVIITVLTAITVTGIASFICWRKFHKGGSIKQNEPSEENNYAQAGGNMNGNNAQEKQSEEYAYASNGPRGIKFPSGTPQQQ